MIKKFLFLMILAAPIIILSQNEPPEIPDGYCSNFTLKIAYFLGTLDLIDDMPAIPDNLVEYKDLVYKTTNDRSLKLDIYHLNNISSMKPLLVFIHGGAWKKVIKKIIEDILLIML